MLEGFTLMYKHDFVKGIFFISSLFMVNVTVIDYMMKLLAKESTSRCTRGIRRSPPGPSPPSWATSARPQASPSCSAYSAQAQ